MSKRVYSVVEASALIGIHRNTLTAWLKDGCPAERKANAELGIAWEVHLPDVIEWMAQRRVEAAVSSLDGGEKVSEDEARRRRVLAQAIQEEIKADEALRRVVQIADVCDRVASEYAAVRSHLQAVGSKVAGKAATLTSAPEIQGLVDDAIREALEAMQYDRSLGPDREPSAG